MHLAAPVAGQLQQEDEQIEEVEVKCKRSPFAKIVGLLALS